MALSNDRLCDPMFQHPGKRSISRVANMTASTKRPNPRNFDPLYLHPRCFGPLRCQASLMRIDEVEDESEVAVSVAGPVASEIQQEHDSRSHPLSSSSGTVAPCENADSTKQQSAMASLQTKKLPLLASQQPELVVCKDDTPFVQDDSKYFVAIVKAALAPDTNSHFVMAPKRPKPQQPARKRRSDDGGVRSL